MQFLCKDYFNAEFSYDYLITVVISEMETGAAVSLTFSEH